MLDRLCRVGRIGRKRWRRQLNGYGVLLRILTFFVYAMSLIRCYRDEDVDVNADIREYMAEYIGYDYLMARMVKYD